MPRKSKNQRAMEQRQRYGVSYNSISGYYVRDAKAYRGEDRVSVHGDNAAGALAEAARLNGIECGDVFRCKISRKAIQATRTTPAAERVQYILFTPVGPVSCESEQAATALAATFGKTISIER